MITFHSLVTGGIPPRPASKSANGTLPTDGFRYCEPLRRASAFGWYVYLPMDIWLLWDGSETLWSIDEGEYWYPLDDAIQFPDFSDRFDAAAPEACKGYSPPFILRGADHDILQIWTGVVVSTEPGMSVLVRGPANLQWRSDFAVLEGIIETDHWFGPLFTNIRLRKMDTPIVLRSIQPFLQVQPVPQDIVLQTASEPLNVEEGLEGLSPQDWERYQKTVVRRLETRQRLGDYAVESRKRNKLNRDVTETQIHAKTWAK